MHKLTLLLLVPLALACGVPAQHKANTLPAGSDSRFTGSVYLPGLESLDFALKDQNGKTVKLSDFKGKTILLSFTFSHCDDVCPFIGVKMLEAIKALGDKAQNLVSIVISIDPDRDTPEQIKKYSDEIGFGDKVHYLIGSHEQLQPIWKAYNIAVAKIDDHDLAESSVNKVETGMGKIDNDRAEMLGEDKSLAAGAPAPRQNDVADDKKGSNPNELPSAKGITAEGLAIADKVIGKFAGGYAVSHSIPFWIIDANQKRVVSASADITPSELAQDLAHVINGLVPGKPEK